MTLRVGESGKRITLVTDFGLSNATSVEILAIPPSGEQNQQTWTAVVNSGALSNITLEDGTVVTSVAADESMYYDIASTSIINEAGTWTLVGRYINTGASPTDTFVSDPVQLTVLDDNFDNTL